MIPEGLVPFTAAQAARQQAILAAEVAAGWLEAPAEDWQLADPDDADFCPAEPAGQPGSQGGAGSAGGPAGDVPREPDGDALSRPAPGAGQAGPDAAVPGGPDAGAGQDRPVAPGAPTRAGTGPDAAEAVPSGITHEAAGPGGRGFASGSVLDTLAPGPVLTGALQDATDAGGLADLPEDDLAGVILAWRRTESHALAGLLAAIAELNRRRLAHPDPHVGEHADAELAILLTMTGRAAIGLLDQATALARLPATMAALRAGQIDRTRAAVLAFETELLDDTLAAAVELLVIENAPGQTSAELRRRLRRAVMAADPGATRRRKDKGAKDARVELQSEQSGNAQLAGRELPPAAAIAADARIDAAARALKAGGVKARLTQLRAAVFLSLLTGADPLQFLPPPAPGPGNGPGFAAGPEPAAEPGLAEESESADEPGSSTAQNGEVAVDGSVNLTVPLSTWLEMIGSPGENPLANSLAAARTRTELADHIAALYDGDSSPASADLARPGIPGEHTARPPPDRQEE